MGVTRAPLRYFPLLAESRPSIHEPTLMKSADQKAKEVSRDILLRHISIRAGRKFVINFPRFLAEHVLRVVVALVKGATIFAPSAGQKRNGHQ